MKEMTLKEIQRVLGYEVKIVADKPRIKYKDVKVGELITVADTEFIVLDKTADGVFCLSKDFVYRDTQFDNNTSDYSKSSIRKKLNDDFLKKLMAEIGEDGLLAHKIDLTSLDGLDDYGFAMDKVSLLTVDMYRKYNRIIEKYPVNDWWWLSTSWSTLHRGWGSTVCVVNYGGTVCFNDCCNSVGVRPFCIFSSSIFES